MRQVYLMVSGDCEFVRGKLRFVEKVEVPDYSGADEAKEIMEDFLTHDDVFKYLQHPYIYEITDMNYERCMETYGNQKKVCRERISRGLELDRLNKLGGAKSKIKDSIYEIIRYVFWTGMYYYLLRLNDNISNIWKGVCVLMIIWCVALSIKNVVDIVKCVKNKKSLDVALKV